LFQDVETHNETIYNTNNNNFAKRIEHVVEQCERVATAVCENIKAGYFPIVLSGDHSSALGTISGMKAAHPNKVLGVIWIDAHADIHSPYTSPSGNIHGMPLAAAMGLDNFDCQINHPEAITIGHWNQMKNIGVAGAKLITDHLIYIGVRDFEEAEQFAMDQNKIRQVKVEELRLRGLETCIQEAIQKLQHCDHIYISFDVDSMDCDHISYGTGTPVPNGLQPIEVMKIIDLFLATNKVSCIEFTEINPLLDNKGNKMAETAFQVLDHISQHI
jgi:arginase